MKKRRILCILAVLLVLSSGVSYVEAAGRGAFRMPYDRTADASPKREEFSCIPITSFSSPAAGAEQRRIQKGSKKNKLLFSADWIELLFTAFAASMQLYLPEGGVTEELCAGHTHRILTDYIHRSDGKKRI